MPETKYFEKEITLSKQSKPAGEKFPARLAYWTIGDISKPAVLMPTCYGGTLETTSTYLYDSEQWPDPILTPSKFFLIITGLFAGGESSSPSNAPEPWNGPNFPRTTYEDNIRMQYALCESLGVKKLFAYIGFSMGGQQAYHISTLYPDFVENMVCLAGSAKTSWHNYCFLEGPREALINSVDFEGGHYKDQAHKGLRAFARVYSTWALSQEWFRQKCWEQIGCKSLHEFLDLYWSGGGDANDRLALLWTWQQGDIGLYYPEDNGDLGKTLARIKTKCLIMPARTDQYFPPEDNEAEVSHLKNGVFKPIDTVWGHLAGSTNAIKEDKEFIVREIKQFLGI